LQEKDSLDHLLVRLTAMRERLSDRHGRRVPLVLKVSPDLDENSIRDIAAAVEQHRLEGVIATNTSVSRERVQGLPHANEAGGLSGAPIRDRATRILKQLKGLLPDVALIGAGGILSHADAVEKRAAGASLIQLYTGLIYRGPGLVAECASAYRAK
jgi:dihydroorotate dehydrogenase